MNIKIFSIFLLAGITLLYVVLILFKNRKLQNKHAYLWISISGFIIAVGLILPTAIILKLSKFAGINYPPSLFMFLGIIFLLFLVLSLSISQSNQEQQIIRLTQTCSLMQEEINSLIKSSEK